jgi:hypothetical protein
MLGIFNRSRELLKLSSFERIEAFEHRSAVLRSRDPLFDGREEQQIPRAAKSVLVRERMTYRRREG